MPATACSRTHGPPVHAQTKHAALAKVTQVVRWGLLGAVGECHPRCDTCEVRLPGTPATSGAVAHRRACGGSLARGSTTPIMLHGINLMNLARAVHDPCWDDAGCGWPPPNPWGCCAPRMHACSLVDGLSGGSLRAAAFQRFSALFSADTCAAQRQRGRVGWHQGGAADARSRWCTHNHGSPKGRPGGRGASDSTLPGTSRPALTWPTSCWLAALRASTSCLRACSSCLS